MDYIGSKTKLTDWIFEKVSRHFPVGGTFLDGCAGAGAVSKAAASKGFRVISNDLMSYSKVITDGCIGLSDQELKIAKELLGEMNDLKGTNGFFYRHYSEMAGRLYFTNDNAAKLDACREFLDEHKIHPKTRSYLLYCLLEAMSRVCNVASTHGAFLKSFKQTATMPLYIRQEEIIKGECISYTSDIFKLLDDEKIDSHTDVFYLDPPYNDRQYAPNYHLYETLVRYDNPVIKDGTTGLREWEKEGTKSVFCQRKDAKAFFKKVLNLVKSKLILISYSSESLLSLSDMEEILVDLVPSGEVSLHLKHHRRFQSQAEVDDKPILREYLFEIVQPDTIFDM
jgi:adenine-specific DNA-methyltransferase